MSDDVREAVAALLGEVDEGRVCGVALVATMDDGRLWVEWAAADSLLPHAGSILRGAVAYLGARMDAKALA